MLSAAGTGRPVAGRVRRAGSLTSMIAPPNPSSRERTSAVVTAAIGSASRSTKSNRAAGTLGSIGT
ncbi:hypothetical protein MYCO108962_26450 [Mycobacterium colombiense]